jgi:hypothetical protein
MRQYRFQRKVGKLYVTRRAPGTLVQIAVGSSRRISRARLTAIALTILHHDKKHKVPLRSQKRESISCILLRQRHIV